MWINIISFVVVLGILIFFHELGHFIVARLFGVGVEKFSLGFGPKLIGKKIGFTEYRISAIPLGGYVKMVGEEPNEKIEPEKITYSFTHKNVFKRILIVAAGPIFNFILSVIIFFFIFTIYGTVTLKPYVGQVQKDMPAYDAGLKKGDLVLSIDGKKITSWQDMVQIIALSGGKKLSITVLREKNKLKFEVIPKPIMQNNLGVDIKKYIIGITNGAKIEYNKLNIFQAAIESVKQTYNYIELTIISVVKLVQGTISTKTLGGPILIAQIAGQQAKAGIVNLFYFIAIISVNLAILNFLPIPVLDGGHLLFYSVEAVTGKPVNMKFREIAQQAGMIILLTLMLYVIYNDVERLFIK